MLRALDRRADLLRRRHRLPRGQARARLRPPHQRPGLRPPRLHRADEGGAGGARRRPGPPRGPDPAVRAHRRGRRARVDVQAPRRVRDARRAHRRDRRRRHALLHALALARLDARPRPRPRPRAVGREPRLLRAVRARAHRVGAAQGRRGARRGRAGRSRGRRAHRAARVRARGWSSDCSASPTRSRRRPTGARRTGSPPTRSTSPRRSPPSTATASSWAPSPPELETFRLRLASPRSGRSPGRSDLLGRERARRRCSASPRPAAPLRSGTERPGPGRRARAGPRRSGASARR